jgi:hypothetical protein
MVHTARPVVQEQYNQRCRQQQEHCDTTVHDIPAQLLVLHLHSLAPQNRLAQLRTDRAFRDLALGSADGLQFSIGIDQQEQCAAARAPQTAEHAARLCPALHLRLHSTTDNVYPPHAAPAITHSITAQLGQVLTALTLQVGAVCTLVTCRQSQHHQHCWVLASMRWQHRDCTLHCVMSAHNSH